MPISIQLNFFCGCYERWYIVWDKFINIFLFFFIIKSSLFSSVEPIAYKINIIVIKSIFFFFFLSKVVQIFFLNFDKIF